MPYEERLKPSGDRVDCRQARWDGDLKLVGDLRCHELRSGHRRERDHTNRTRPARVESPCHLQRQPRLAHPAAPDEAHQPDGRVGDQPQDRSQLSLTADERGGLHRAPQSTAQLLIQG